MNQAQPFWVAVVACSALFLVILDNTIVNVAIVPIARALSADVHTIQWVVGAYFLAQAAVIPVTGYFASRYGSRRSFLVALMLFVSSSGLCGFANSGLELIVYRVLQGLGGGALYPLAQAIAFGAYDRQARIKGVSLTMVPGVLAPTLGPVTGGWLTLEYGWPAIFLINVPLGIVFLVAATRVLPRDRERTFYGRFDVAGLVLCSTGVLALTYGFSLVGTPAEETIHALLPFGRSRGWGDTLTLSCILGGIFVLLGFVAHEVRRVDPVLELRLFKRRRFAAATIIASINNAIFFGSMLVLPLFLIQVREPHLSSLEVGFLIAPQGMGSALMLIAGMKLRRVWGVAPLVVLGSSLLALSSWGIAAAASRPGILTFMPWIFARGMGFGTVFQLTQGMIVEGLPARELPRATSLFNVVRQVSSSLGLALMLSIFDHWSEVNAEMLRQSLGDRLNAEMLIERAGVAAFEDLFRVLAGVSLLGAVVAAVVLKSSRSSDGHEPESAVPSSAAFDA